jgi:hypothetical protein
MAPKVKLSHFFGKCQKVLLVNLKFLIEVSSVSARMCFKKSLYVSLIYPFFLEPQKSQIIVQRKVDKKDYFLINFQTSLDVLWKK